MCRWLPALAVVVTCASPVWAHGPAPTPLRVLTTSGEIPDVVLTNIGIAVRTGESYAYVCPSLWGGLETPLAVGQPAGEFVVVGTDAIHVATQANARSCSLTASPAFGPVDSSSIVALASGPDLTVIARVEGDQTSLIAADPLAGAPFASYEMAGRADGALWTGAEFIVSGARPELAIHRVGDGDPTTARPTAPGPGSPQRLTPRYATASSVYFSAITDDGVELWRSEDRGATLVRVLSGELSLHGPAAWCGGVIAVLDGAIVADPEAPPLCDMELFSGRRFQCLQNAGSFTYACENRVLYSLRDAEIQPVFEVQDIDGPACPDARCDRDWLHFGAEAGLVDTSPPDVGPDAPDAGSDPGSDTTTDTGVVPDAAQPGDVAPAGRTGGSGCSLRGAASGWTSGWSWRRR